MITVWEWIKDDWIILKRDIKNLGINPNKEYDSLTFREMMWLADFLDICVSDLVS